MVFTYSKPLTPPMKNTELQKYINENIRVVDHNGNYVVK